MHIFFMAYNTAIIVCQLSMKQKKEASQSEEEEEEDDDSYSLRLWKATKRQPTAIDASLVLTKKTAGTDGKKTVKYRDDPVIEGLVTSILREGNRFPEEGAPSMETENINKEQIEQYEPNLIRGKVINSHICTEQEMKQYGLEDESQCLQFDLNPTVRVVVVGKLYYIPLEGADAHLYLPKHIASFLFLKETQKKGVPLPKNMIKTSERTIILIQRRKQASNNILDYCYFVIDPKNLIYPTYLCSWINCKRRLALTNFVLQPKQVNEHTVFGNTCHRMLEWLSDGVLTSSAYLQNPLQHGEKLYKSMVYDMYLIKKSFMQFWQTCETRIKNIVLFFRQFIQNNEQMLVEPYRKLYLKITKIIESQIMLRSSILGLKGKIDLLLFGELIDRKSQITTPVYIPMELKSGRRVSDAHKKQTDIYNILVREKYKHPTMGLLYYSDSDIKFFRYEEPLYAYEIVIVHRNIVAQNLYAIYLQDSGPTLPPLPESFSQCNYCNSSLICQTNMRQCSKQISEQLPSKYHPQIKKQLQAMTPQQKDYVTRWFSMLYKEQKEYNCVFEDNTKMGLFLFKISCHGFSSLFSKGGEKKRLEVTHQCNNFQEVTLFNDYYRPSVKIRCSIPEIYLLQNCKIYDTFIETASLLFTVTLEFNSTEIKFSQRKVNYLIQQGIDCKTEFQPFTNQIFPSLRTTAFNLVKSQHFVKKIALTNEPSQQPMPLEEKPDQHSEVFVQGLNRDQNLAFSRAVSANQFCLIQGMPGTGKTELIIRLIHYFCKQNVKILVTTFTNQALDNILGRLQQSKRVDSDLLIREGSQFSTATNLHHFTSRSQTFNSTQDYENYFGIKKAWFVTLSSLSIHHLPEAFDIVILDEASQCLQPSCLGALLRCKKFILIGDYLQLQPLVRSKEAAKQGMNLSLFQRLCSNYPSNLVSLKKQYRMNQRIMALSNELVYHGKLELASEAVKKKSLVLRKDWEQLVPASFQEVISPSAPIVFINYDPIINALVKKYANQQPTIRKVIQTQLPVFIANIFRKLDIPSASLAVITALNISVNRIMEMLNCEKYRSQSVLTIDKSQGIDREVVVLLIERGNEELVENPRRLNVALTRAKSKLIVIASESHLQRMKVWEGSLARLLKEYQLDLTKAMILDMIKGLSDS